MSRKHSNTPPYVPRAGFRAVLDSIQNHKPGEVIRRDVLHKKGLSSHLIYPAIAALRYLGLIDDQDVITGKHVVFNRDDPDRNAQEALVREAYSLFFQKVPLPVADVVTLKRQFQTVFDLSDRVVNSAFPLFQYLSQEAGIALTAAGVHAPILDEVRHPVHTIQEMELETLGQQPDETQIEGGPNLPAGVPLRVKHTGYQIVVNLQVTKYTSEKDIQKMIRTANRAIHLMRKAGDSH